jgi:hypothetical protein
VKEPNCFNPAALYWTRDGPESHNPDFQIVAHGQGVSSPKHHKMRMQPLPRLASKYGIGAKKVPWAANF